MARPSASTVETTPISVFTSLDGETETVAAYRLVFDSWAPGSEELYVPTTFGLTHVIANGPRDGPPVVLLHALLATAMAWYRNVPGLSRHYRTYAVDIIGEANLSKPTRPMTSLDDFLVWFTELLDGLGLETVFVVGNSYGGFTGAYYAMRLPQRVRKLVLIGPASTISPMTPFMRHMFYPKAFYLMLPRAPGSERVMRRAVDWIHAGTRPDPLWEPLFYRTMVYGKLINRVFPRMYTPEEFSQIGGPVLLILGENEAIYDDLDAAAGSARRLIADLEVELIPAAHHITALAQPRLTNERIVEFFSET